MLLAFFHFVGMLLASRSLEIEDGNKQLPIRAPRSVLTQNDTRVSTL